MEKLKRILDKYSWLLMVLLLVPASWALFVPGFFGASDDIHVAWLYELHRSLIMGQIPPRFVPDLSFGFGYPLFNFVFPFPFYVAEIFHLVGFSLVDSIKLLFFISIPLSFVFMYLFLRQFTSRALSMAGAVLYIYTPYRAVDLYVRGAIGEVVSFVFLPLISLSVTKISQNKNLRWVGIGGLALAALVLSHNITAYMFLPFVGLFFLMQFFLSSRKKAFFVQFILMIFLGLLTSIYFWLPAIVESNLMRYDTVFNFADHFPTFSQLITPYWGYGASIPGPYDGMSFFLGFVNLFLLLAGVICTIIFWKKFSKEVKMLLEWTLVLTVSALLLMNYRSLFLWNHIPYLPYFQFPWRFLILTTFAIPIFVITLEKLKNSKLISFSLIILVLITVGSFFRPQDFLGRKDDYYLNRYIPTPAASQEYLKTQEEYLRLPKATKKRPDRNFPPIAVANGTITQIDKRNDLDVSVKVQAILGAELIYNKYFFPGWVAEIDGLPRNIVVGEPFGQIKVLLSPGEHEVKIAFEETNFRKIFDAISLISFLVLLRMCFLEVRAK